MDSKRGHHRNAPSSSDSSSNSPASPSSPVPPPPGHGVGKSQPANTFANDGSFMEMFKKKMEEERRKKEQQQDGSSDLNTAEEGQSTQDKKPVAVASFVGKRRGGAKLALKTGMVAKKRQVEDEKEEGKSDAWSKYMAEVKKYKAHQCGDDDKTRPLVK